VVAELARVVKRELRSEQNELLDSLRNRRGAPGLEVELLVPGEAAGARLAAATTTALVGAWRAGVSFVLRDGQSEIEPGAEPAAVAAELADEVVTSLRLRLEEALRTGDGDDASAELVGAAYRQWRGERVEVLVGDHVAKAFSLGTLAALKRGAPVRWVVDDGDEACPDCDDNALAGPLGAGDTFPTGQVHPPVHSGCRCLLVPTGS
jgi:hypothetical protein